MHTFGLNLHDWNPDDTRVWICDLGCVSNSLLLDNSGIPMGTGELEDTYELSENSVQIYYQFHRSTKFHTCIKDHTLISLAALIIYKYI